MYGRKGIQGRRHCRAVSLMVGGDYITTERRIKQFYVPVVKFVYYIKQIGNMFLCVNEMLTWWYVLLTGIACSPGLWRYATWPML